MTAIRVPTTLAHAQGAYTCRVLLGSARQPVHLLLDTGSSALAVLPHAYDPAGDGDLQPTTMAQEVIYGAGGWAGPVLRSCLRFDNADGIALDDGQFALIEACKQDFRGADGILGLAYGGLDHARDFAAWLAGRGITPPLTWPWPTAALPAELQAFRQLAGQQPAVALRPAFDALERAGLVSDRFEMMIRRALLHVADDGADAAALERDPFNRGELLLGVDAAAPDAPAIRIVHDLYYNVNLQALQIGDEAPLPAPLLAERDIPAYASNAIVDTGCSFILLEHSLYQAMLAAFDRIDPRLGQTIAAFRSANARQQGVANEALDGLPWPPLVFHLEAPDGGTTVVRCGPDAYWQRNALRAGQAWLVIGNQLPQWPAQSVLGLPLWCGRRCLFDRSVAPAGRLQLFEAG